MTSDKQKILDLNDELSKIKRRIAVFEDRIKTSREVLKKYGIKTKKDAEIVLRKLQKENASIRKRIEDLTKETVRQITKIEADDKGVEEEINDVYR